MNKQLILDTIYQKFDQWSSDVPAVCSKGCSTCCTQEVTVSAPEAEKILQYIIDNHKLDWFAQRVKLYNPPAPPTCTTNEYAQACFDQQEIEQPEKREGGTCPFLIDNSCSIYEIRPFSCRCFISKTLCSKVQPAEVPEYYLSGSTAVQQLLEHMGQNDYWGNLFDVLLALCTVYEYSQVGDHLPTDGSAANAKQRVKWAKPLPGFLLTEEDIEQVGPLLQSIFEAEIEGKTIEEIFNGK